MGWKADAKECKQKYYGGYCNSVRQQGFEPLFLYRVGKDKLS